MEVQTVLSPKKWALIQTASILENADVLPFKSEAGQRVPVVLFTHEDESRVRKMKRRILANASKVTGFDQKDTVTSVPVLGIIQVSVIATIPKVKVAVPPSAPLIQMQTLTEVKKVNVTPKK
ncbi:hypothetical protein MUP79_05455 [Candidatus Bathyarchaeota archaeon]|nr:hypothetical protein [Candidatus Bathyarchaeota archaeon]